MRTRDILIKLRGKFTLLFMTLGLLLAIPAIALADTITNNADATVDATAEVMALTAGGANGTTQLSVITANGDGKNGCNLTGSTTASFSVNSSNTAVATVSPTSVTFTACGEVKTLTVTPLAQGSTNISLTQTANTTGATFDVTPATFTVNVTAPPPSNTPPQVSVNGVTEGASYEKGSVPAATCQVTDTEDGPSTPAATIDSSNLDQYGLGQQTATCSYTDNGGLQASTSKTYLIVDTTAPVIAAHDDVTAEATSANGAAVTYTAPNANDAVYGNLGDANCTPVSGSQFDLGDTTVTCTATDGSGNQATPTTFKVTVADTTAPVIASHDDVTAEATGADGANVSYTSPGTTDAVDGPGTANCTPASGTTFAVGSTTVTCTATDGHNNTATSTFKVNVAYSWSNFLQPINVTGTQSVFKLGSTVPVKFNLTGASSGITDGTFYLKYFYLGAGDGLGEQEAVATTTGTTGTEFRYSAGQYIYNWSTKSVSKPGNYELRVYSDSAGTVLLGKVAIEIKK
jgi:hypothetical protein